MNRPLEAQHETVFTAQATCLCSIFTPIISAPWEASLWNFSMSSPHARVAAKWRHWFDREA
jgi:hypothetical protein